MSFLNPIMLGGLAAIAVPIIIHLLNRRRFQKVVWAAMRFLQISVEQNQRRMRVEDMILLILRCLLLALLALALARPAFLSEGSDVFGQSKVTGVIVLDNSYSMGMSDGTSTRFEKARSAAEDAIASMPSGSATAVILASDMADDVIPEPTFDLNLARETIRKATLTDRSTDLFPALDAAITILQDRLAIRKEIFVVTDGQATGWKQLVEIQKLLEKTRSEIKSHLILVNEGETGNHGLSGLRMASGLSPANQPLRFEVRVTNFGLEESRNIKVTLNVNEEPPSDEFNIDAIAPGATRSISLFTKLPQPGYHTVTARIPRDRLMADDQRSLAVRALKQVRVLLVDGEPGLEPRDSETYFLGHALAPVPREQQESYFIRHSIITGPEMSQARFDDYDVVVLANVDEFTETTQTNLVQYLRRGGGLLIFPGGRVNDTFYNETLYDELRLLPARLGNPRGEADDDEVALHFQDKDYQHPVVAIWNDPAAGNLASARIFRSFPLQPEPILAQTNREPALEEAGAGPREWGEAKVILYYSDGTPAVMERDWGLGRVVLFSSTADNAWSDLPVRLPFVPLVHRTLGAMVQRQDESLNIRVGDPFKHRTSLEFLGKDATFFKPRETDAIRELRQVELVDQWPMLQFEKTDHAGLYEVSVVEPPLEMTFAAQSSPDESSLDTLSPDQITTLKDVATVIEWTPDTSLKSMVEQDRSGLEFWLPLVVLCLMLAMVETFLAQWFSRSK